jgi:hypothetical protein
VRAVLVLRAGFEEVSVIEVDCGLLVFLHLEVVMERKVRTY